MLVSGTTNGSIVGYPDLPLSFHEFGATSDRAWVYRVVGEASGINGNVICQTVSALEGATREDAGTIRGLFTSDDPTTEFVDVACHSGVYTGGQWMPLVGPMYYGLGNEKTSAGGTKAVLHYYWRVEEFTPYDTGNIRIAEPCEP